MGQQQDLESLVTQHVPLVRSIAYQLAARFPRHVDHDELARAGMLGLVEAAQRFDPTRGVPFGRYAATRIRGAILDGVRAVDWAPRSVRHASRRLGAATQELSAELGRQPTSAELAQALGTDVDQLAALRGRIHRSVLLTLDEVAPVDRDEERVAIADLVSDDTGIEPSEEMERRELHSYLRDALQLLPERHRLVIVGYFLENRTSDELGRLLGVTESRVSQLRSQALEMLRQGIEAQYDGTARDPVTAKGRVAKREAAYAVAIAARSPWHHRLGQTPTPVASGAPA